MRFVKQGFVFKTGRGYITVRKENANYGNVVEYLYFTEDLYYATVFDSVEKFTKTRYANLNYETIQKFSKPLPVEVVETRDVILQS